MSLSTNLVEIHALIQNACSEAHRNPEDISLVCVSKFHSIERIEEALKEGERVFGENRVQEAYDKWPLLKDKYPDVSLHLIGGLQTNKTKEAVALFDVIESVDRPKLAQVLAQEIKNQNKNPEIYIQVNTGEEEQKNGCLPKDLDQLMTLCKDLNLNVTGLMCIPPVDEEPSPHFAFLKKLAKRYQLKKLSMGMSGDFETAILQGATSVRIGTAIFGQRTS